MFCALSARAETSWLVLKQGLEKLQPFYFQSLMSCLNWTKKSWTGTLTAAKNGLRIPLFASSLQPANLPCKFLRHGFEIQNLSFSDRLFCQISKVAFFRMPKTEDHFTGHRFEKEPNGFLHVIEKFLVRALRVV